jgi:hypothetical protein
MTGIDTSFDFRTDTAPGKDPDTFSRVLGRYHQQLWSKPLPNGIRFDLAASSPPVYLHHRSEVGEFWLSSDSVIHTYSTWVSMASVIDRLPDADIESFRTIAYTIGGMMVWPANRIQRALTINGARGLTRSISDRFDLTLECVRRHYLGLPSPLGAVLTRYVDFFALFTNFTGFVEFFLLQDLVTDDGSQVRFFMPFDDFEGPAVPRDLRTYVTYKRNAVEFVRARNERIGRLSAAAE